MRRSAELGLRHVAGVMRQHRIEEVLDVPAAPLGSGLRYPRVVRLDPGDQAWYLRSFGTDFEIVPSDWLRRGLDRCYSVGADLEEAGERDGLLLVQAFTADLPGAESLAGTLVEELSPIAERVAAKWDTAWNRPCCWVAAVLPAEPERADHA